VLRRNPGLREKIVVQDKCGICKGYYDLSEKHILEAVDGSLSRLGLDSIDALLLHRPDALVEPEEVASAFEKLEKAGKVRFFGVSNMNPAQIELLEREMPGRIIIDQLQFGPAFTGMVDEGISANTQLDQAVVRTGAALDYCRLHNITIQAWSPLQYGMFMGPFMQCEDYAQLNACMHELALEKGVEDVTIAIAWILRHPAKMQAIIGSMNPERIAAAARAMDTQISRPEWYRMYAAAGNPIP
jgi:predicted oxidoreductase